MKKALIPTVFLIASCATNPVAQREERSLASAPGYQIHEFVLIERVKTHGTQLHEETEEWMKKWREMDLEDSSLYQFHELSGSTSINLKIQKVDASDEKGYKSRGSFVPRNGAANPNTEIAYFHLATIFGVDQLIRPAARYELGPSASKSFKDLINKTPIKGTMRNENKTRILSAIATGKPLLGCLKAKKSDEIVALDELADKSAPHNGAPKLAHPTMKYLQAQNPKPQSGTALLLKKDYTGDALQLSREYSILMTLDSIFEQWDRYSGGNITLTKDDSGQAHFFSTDNGGADLSKAGSWAARNLSWFSRYDRKVVERIKELKDFFDHPGAGYLGYTDPEVFVVDLGLYFELKPAVYVERFKRNLGLFLERVATLEKKYGDQIYFD